MTFKQLVLGIATILVVASTLTTPSLADLLDGMTLVLQTMTPMFTSNAF